MCSGGRWRCALLRDVSEVPDTRYVRTPDGHIAYQVFGDGPPDIIYVATWFSHVDGRWDEPSSARWLRRMARFGRVIVFDRRGTGASDPMPVDSGLTWEDWASDIAAVMDEVGSTQASLIAAGDGGAMAILFTASHPERVRNLALVNSSPRPLQDTGYPGLTQAQVDTLITVMEKTWGQGAFDSWAPSRAGDESFRRWWGRYQRMSASPGVSAAVARRTFQADVRHVLPTISVPTLVLHARDFFIPWQQARFVADHIPGATYVEVPGADAFLFTGEGADQIQDALEEFVTGQAPRSMHDRVLATVVFTDIVDSTSHAARVGDARWRELLGAHDALLRQALREHRGREVHGTGDGMLATFDGPARAIRFGCAVADAVGGLGLAVRVGMHTGEIERRGHDIVGVAVHLASRVAGAAGPNEVLVSRTVRDLVAGSGITLRSRGMHRFKGVADPWELFAAVEA